MKIARLQPLLPPGFFPAEKGGSVWVVRDGWEKVLVPLGGRSREELAAAFPGAEHLRGRGRPLVLPVGGKRLVVRRYRHGGLLGGITGDLLVGSGRPLRELAVLERARLAGLPVPLALGVFLHPAFAGLARADLVTEYIPDAEDLLALLRGNRVADGAACLAGRLVARAHAAGFYHADLNLKNIVIRETASGLEGYLIDWDQSFFRPRLSRPEKERNLLRLYRSYLKMAFPKRADPRPALRFLLAYAPRDRAFRRSLVRRAQRGGDKWHRWHWRMREKVFGSRYARSRE